MIERQKDTKNQVCVVLVTFPNEEVASQIGTQLVELQLIACVNLLPGVSSIYRWEGKVLQEKEVVGLLKTTLDRVTSLELWIQENHPYDEPEFLVLPAAAGSVGYLEWVRDEVSGGETAVDKTTS